jgi:hypothetical protein
MGNAQDRQGDSDIRASDADRDGAIAVLNDALTVGQLSPEEHGDRVQAALTAKSRGELTELTADLGPLPMTIQPSSDRRRHAVVVVALVALGVLILVAGLVAVLANKSKSPSRTTHASTSTPAVLPSSVAKVVASPKSAAVNGVEIQVIPPGSFSPHDPADECGDFGPSYKGGGNNCYVVVRFINSDGSSVTFTPADLHMVDQNDNEYMLEPVAPPCYDTFDVNASQTLQSGGAVDVQLCFPVATGALPQAMKGTRSLAGLTLSVPSYSIDGTWGGS